jgi:hypothetical protein
MRCAPRRRCRRELVSGRLAVPLVALVDETANVCHRPKPPNLYSHYANQKRATVAANRSQLVDRRGRARSVDALVRLGQCSRRSQGHVGNTFVEHIGAPRTQSPGRILDGIGLRGDGASRDRTGDLLLAKQALSQLSYGPLGAECSDGSHRSRPEVG